MAETTEIESRWDDVRSRFQFSPMADTRLTTLAENASAKSWPLRGVDETPAKYFDASVGELKTDFNLDDEQIVLLIEILEETLLFDDGYTAMISPQIESDLAENQITTSLNRLGIPEDFPIELSGLSAETIELCGLEGVKTVGDFAEFSQRMADNVILGGDFKAILNALAHADDVGISKYLPLRPGKKGLQFPEAVGILIRKLSDEEQDALASAAGYKASTIPAARAKAIAPKAKETLERLFARIRGLLPDQTQEFLAEIQSGQRTVERSFLILDDPRVEHIAVDLVGPLIKGKAKAVAVVESESAEAPVGRVLGGVSPSVEPKKKGFFARLFGRK